MSSASLQGWNLTFELCHLSFQTIQTMSCIFCKIINREIPGEIIYETDDVIVFKDINPKAPVHFLIIPKAHLGSVNDIDPEFIEIAGKLLYTAKVMAEKLNIAKQGYRLIINCGKDSGQIVDHLHLHFLAGKKFNRN